MYNDAEIIRAGMSLVPDYAEQQQKQLLADLTRQQTASQIFSRQMEATKFANQQAREQSYLQAVTALGQKPSYEGYRDLMMRFPEHHQALAPVYRDEQDRKRDQGNSQIAEIIGSARNGRWDLAASAATKYIDFDANNGAPGGGNVDADREIVRILENGTPEERGQVIGILTHRLIAGVGHKQTAEMWNAVFDEERDRELQPDKLREQAASAVIKEAEAENAGDYFGGRAREQVADAEIAENNSAWQDAKNAIGVQKSGAQLANARSLIAKRARALGKPVDQVTTGDMRRHYEGKRGAGVPLSPAEAKGEEIFAPQPKPKSKAKAPPKAGPTIIVNPKTGERKMLRNGKWVTI